MSIPEHTSAPYRQPPAELMVELCEQYASADLASEERITRAQRLAVLWVIGCDHFGPEGNDELESFKDTYSKAVTEAGVSGSVVDMAGMSLIQQRNIRRRVGRNLARRLFYPELINDLTARPDIVILDGSYPPHMDLDRAIV